jgi:hypothetical protein
MVIEAKASSNINYRNGRWYYNEKIPMCHDGPYRQADSSKWALKREIEDKIGMDFCKRCKMLHAVWFPLVNRRQIQNLKFHTDASSDITLGEEELENPTPFIESIYNHNVASIKTDINDVEKEKLFDEVLCPYCEIVEGYGTGRKRKERIFFKLLEAQKDLLNYLAYQKTAAIQGIAGTGKTLLALEKAKRLASKGGKILFLCYNRKLCDYLKKNFNYRKDQVDFFTIAGFASHCVGYLLNVDYTDFRHYIEDNPEEIEQYTDIIIDEGQDFGTADIEESGILQLFYNLITSEKVNGSFYIFG